MMHKPEHTTCTCKQHRRRQHQGKGRGKPHTLAIGVDPLAGFPYV
jgi:hypothetical protein